jgi:hypothetical protein
MSAIPRRFYPIRQWNRRPDRQLYLTLKVRRNRLLDDAVIQLSAQTQESFLRKLRVVFQGENAVDVGGPSREFLYLLAEQLFSPDLGMFVVKGRYNWFSPSSFEGDRSYFLVGAVIGLAIHNGILLPIRFPLVVYKKLMTPNRKLTLNDLAEIDPEVVRSLKEIGRMADRGEDIRALGLTFDATVDCFGEAVTFPIRDGMSGIEVDNMNANLYVRSYVQFMLSDLIETRFAAFRRGFEFVTTSAKYKMLDPSEVDLLVSGEEVMDWDALKRSTTYKDGYTVNSTPVRWFWEIFGEFSSEMKRKFLKFATGTDRSPLGGLGNVKLAIQRGADPGRLPVSHTCFNLFTLPAYPAKEYMKDRLVLAIEHTEGFGIV